MPDGDEPVDAAGREAGDEHLERQAHRRETKEEPGAAAPGIEPGAAAARRVLLEPQPESAAAVRRRVEQAVAPRARRKRQARDGCRGQAVGCRRST